VLIYPMSIYYRDSNSEKQVLIDKQSRMTYFTMIQSKM
jgi:hypothetical protein